MRLFPKSGNADAALLASLFKQRSCTHAPPILWLDTSSSSADMKEGMRYERIAPFLRRTVFDQARGWLQQNQASTGSAGLPSPAMYGNQAAYERWWGPCMDLARPQLRNTHDAMSMCRSDLLVAGSRDEQTKSGILQTTQA